MPTFRVMVVTEDPVLRAKLMALLSEPSFEAFPAADGFDALRQIYYVAPQVIIADTELVNYAGFELMPFLRRRFPEVAVVALERENWRKADHSDEVAADEYVRVDPLTPVHLADALARLTAKCTHLLVEAPIAVGSGRAARITTIRVNNGCPTCTELRQSASRARMQSLLAHAWHRMHVSDDDAARQSNDADAAMQQAMSHLRLHRRRAHRQLSSRTEPQKPACDAMASPPRYAAS